MLATAVSGQIKYFIDAELREQGYLLAFSTRTGGVSQAPFSALNISARSTDDPGKVSENRRLLSRALGIEPEDLTFADQVHGVRVAGVMPETAGAGSKPGKQAIEATDALVTDTSNIPLVILTADCVPVLLVDTVAKIVGAAHAGWRGTFDRIAANTVAVMVEKGATVRRIKARIGPAIGSCCYEIDAELFSRFSARFHLPVGESLNLDLAALNKRILLECGLQPENIEALGLCTACNEELFYSWRRSKDMGRLASIAAVL